MLSEPPFTSSPFTAALLLLLSLLSVGCAVCGELRFNGDTVAVMALGVMEVEDGEVVVVVVASMLAGGESDS